MYLDKLNNNNTDYLRILQSYSVIVNGKRTTRKKIIINLGPLSKFDDGNPDYFQRLRESFKSGIALIPELEPYVNKKQPEFESIKISRQDSNQYLAHPKNIGYLLLEKILSQLEIPQLLAQYQKTSKISYDLVGIFQLFVYGRILKPASKIATVAQNDSYLFDLCSKVSKRDIYRSLDVLNNLNTKIQQKIDSVISQSSIGRKRELTYYDVTNFFFHIDHEDEFRKRGKSKENRVEPIVQMGLFIDNNGIPIAHQEFPGNNIDQTTLRPAIKTTIKKFNLEKIVVVADGGMNSGKNRAYLATCGHGYIVSKSVKVVKNEIRKWILDSFGYMNQNGVEADDFQWKYKSRIISEKVKDENGNWKELTEKEIVFFSPKYYQKQLHEQQLFHDYLESCCEHPKKVLKSAKSYLHVVDSKIGEIKDSSELKYSIDENKLEEQREIMGYYLIKTSEIDLDDLEIIDRYHGLSKIEDCFRITKSNLNGRPVYVRTPEHIKAHFLICFVALTIIRLIQIKYLLLRDGKVKSNGWEEGITAFKLQEGLNSWTASFLGEGCYRVSEPTEDIKEMIDQFGINWKMFLPSKEKIKRNFDKIPSL
jgi:transposase